MINNAKRILFFSINSPPRLAYESGRRQKIKRALFFCLALLALGYAPASTIAQEVPSVSAQANAPGWITIIWEHSGRGATGYLLQRQEPAFTWVFETNLGKYTDMGLKASTTYKYRVCVVDSSDKETCSPWVSVTTLPPESSGSLSIPIITRQEPAPDRIGISWSSTTRYGSFNVRWSEKGGRARQVNVKGSVTSGSYEVRDLQPGRNYVIGLQGCNWGLLGSSCSGWRVIEIMTPLPPPPPPAAPALTATASSENRITLTWPVNEAERITRTVVERDGRTHNESDSAMSQLDDAVRPNTEYSYRVCVTNQTGSACSNAITAMARPVAPSALANVAFTQSRFSGAPGGPISGESARIKTILRATWRNTATPGQFIVLEREDRGPTGPITVGRVWTEVNRISAKTDPTEIAIEAEPAGQVVGGRVGSTYRVCAVVPALGNSGRICSLPSGPTQGSAQTKESIGLSALVAKGEAIANQDPLAVELRNQQAEGLARRGFDIGMAAAEGQTAPGPGKDRIRDSLSRAEQEGFNAAVAFSLERNRYAARAALGATIARVDPVVGKERNASSDVFYKLGFDIATAIFGDPALGAQGNTATGPGSLGIRDSLSPSGQRGFNASVEFNLRRRGVK